MKKQSKVLQGQYLKEVSFDFATRDKVSVNKAKKFIIKVIDILGTEMTSMTLNSLPPGFDLLTGIKESCIYFGCWGEYNYIHLLVSSCKNYNTKKIFDFIIKYFDTIPKVKIVHNKPIRKMIEELRNV